MSTPAPADREVDGPEFYAPPRIRMQSASQSEASPPVATAGTPLDPEKSGPAKVEPQGPDQEAGGADSSQVAQTELLRAVRLALESGNPDCKPRPDAHGKRPPPQSEASRPDATAVTPSDAEKSDPAKVEPQGADQEVAADPWQVAQTELLEAVRLALKSGNPSRKLRPDAHDRRPAPAANLRPSQPEAINGTPWRDPSPPPWRTIRPARPRPQLDSEVVPQPTGQSTGRGTPRTLRIVLAFGFAASAAFGITMMASLHRSGELPKRSSRLAETAAAGPNVSIKLQSSPRLVVKSEAALANRPLPLAVSIQGAAAHDSLLLAGLAAGTQLSAGTPTGKTGWRLRPEDLDQVYVYAPPGFVGVMNTAFNLLSPEERLIDSRTAQLEWLPASPPSQASSVQTKSKQPNVDVLKTLDADEAAHLMTQGEDFLKLGDIAAARLAFRRLAQAGNADAALELAKTYDPRYLADHDVIGMTGNETKANAWYQRARQLEAAQANHTQALTAAQ